MGIIFFLKGFDAPTNMEKTTAVEDPALDGITVA